MKTTPHINLGKGATWAPSSVPHQRPWNHTPNITYYLKAHSTQYTCTLVAETRVLECCTLGAEIFNHWLCHRIALSLLTHPRVSVLWSRFMNQWPCNRTLGAPLRTCEYTCGYTLTCEYTCGYIRTCEYTCGYILTCEGTCGYTYFWPLNQDHSCECT
jgi:hypothetical protein